MSLVDSSRLALVLLEKVVHSPTLLQTVGFRFLPRTWNLFLIHVCSRKARGMPVVPEGQLQVWPQV